MRLFDLAFPSPNFEMFSKKAPQKVSTPCLPNSSGASIDVFAAPGNGSGRFVLFQMSLISPPLLLDAVALLKPSFVSLLGSDEYVVSLEYIV